MTASPLPRGWDLARIRDESGDESAEILDTDRIVVTGADPEAGAPARAVAAFGFHDLAIVRLADDDAWQMGSRDSSTCTVDLWAQYNDFGEAVRGL